MMKKYFFCCGNVLHYFQFLGTETVGGAAYE